MTLPEAFASYAAHLHSKTLRRFLAFAVVNAANSNHTPTHTGESA